MKKLVFKTAAITLAVIILLAALTAGALALFAPLSLARFFEGAGNGSAATVFYIRQYERSGDFNDLAVLCDKIDEHAKPDKAEKYLAEFTGSNGFSDYCAEYDRNYGGSFSAREMFRGRYVVAVYLNSGVTRATAQAEEFSRGDYTEYNAFYWLITDSEVEISASAAAELAAGIRASGASGEFALRDLSLLSELTGD